MRVRIVDAFTDRAFAGNPAAVCFLDGADWPDADWMQRVAAELNMPMTAFALPHGDTLYQTVYSTDDEPRFNIDIHAPDRHSRSP